MGIKRDLTGKVYSRLTVLGRADPPANRKGRGTYWKCQCICGKTTVVPAFVLASGNTRSCGCLRIQVLKEQTRARLTEPRPISQRREYRVWMSLLRRLDAQEPSPHAAKLHPAWRDFDAFYRDLGECPQPKENYHLQRRTRCRDYTPETCSWVCSERITLPAEVKVPEEPMTIAQLSRLYGLPYSYLYYRIRGLGWTLERALTPEPEANET